MTNVNSLILDQLQRIIEQLFFSLSHFFAGTKHKVNNVGIKGRQIKKKLVKNFFVVLGSRAKEGEVREGGK